MRCPHCGADNPPDVAACQYCGAHLPQSMVAGKIDRDETFQRIKKSPEFAQSNSPQRHAKLPKHHPVQKALLFGFFGIFVAGAAFIFIMMLGLGGVLGFAGGRAGGGGFGLIPICMSIVPLGMAALGLFLFLATRKKMQTIETSPVVALPVIVLDKRTHVSGGGKNSSARTEYFVTCELEDGMRKEYQAWDGALYGGVAPDDAGVLYLRAEYALDFDRVAV